MALPDDLAVAIGKITTLLESHGEKLSEISGKQDKHEALDAQEFKGLREDVAELKSGLWGERGMSLPARVSWLEKRTENSQSWLKPIVTGIIVGLVFFGLSFLKK